MTGTAALQSVAAEIAALDAIFTRGRDDGADVEISFGSSDYNVASITRKNATVHTFGGTLSEAIGQTLDGYAPCPAPLPCSWNAALMHELASHIVASGHGIHLWGQFAKDKGNVFRAAIDWMVYGYGSCAEVAIQKAIDKYVAQNGSL